jgi:hypothetical protein
MKMRTVILAFSLSAFALLAGCKPTATQTRLDLAPGFYASAIAYDRRLEQYLVGSYQTGDVLAVLAGGQPLMQLRKGGIRARGAGGEPVTRLVVDEAGRDVWVALPEAVEIIDRQTLSVRRIDIPGAFIADLAVSEGGIGFALDVKRGQLLRIDASADRVTTAISFADARASAPADGIHTQAPLTVAERIAQGGALAVMPDGRSLLIATGNGRLWRFDTAALELSRVPLKNGRGGDSLLAGVSQLLVVGGDARGYRLVAFAGMANRMQELDIPRGFSAAGAIRTAAATVDTPLRAAWDGRRVQVLLGSLRHHPDLRGDGHPSLPARMLSYVPLDTGLQAAVASRESVSGYR